MRRFRPPRLTPNAALAGLTPEVLAWEAAVVTNGGAVSVARRLIVNQFILAEKSDGTWSQTDDYWALWGESAAQSLTSLKQRRLATAVNSPTFTTDRGYDFNGTTQYLNTGFVPSTHAVAMTGTNLRIAVYERTNVSANVTAAGCYINDDSSLVSRPRSGGVSYGYVNSQYIPYTLPAADSRGYTVFSRNGAGAAESAGYKNGAAIVQVSSGTFGSSLANIAVYAGCRNNSGTPFNFRACYLGFVAVGASLLAAQEIAQYNNVQAFATAVGAQV